MISLGLFALIAVAGLALVEGIINVQGRTEKRFDRLADLQRTMFVVSSDVEQIADGPISGGGANLSFTRSAPGMGGAAVPLRYGVVGGALVRSVGPAPQLAARGRGACALALLGRGLGRSLAGQRRKQGSLAARGGAGDAGGGSRRHARIAAAGGRAAGAP